MQFFKQVIQINTNAVLKPKIRNQQKKPTIIEIVKQQTNHKKDEEKLQEVVTQEMLKLEKQVIQNNKLPLDKDQSKLSQLQQQYQKIQNIWKLNKSNHHDYSNNFIQDQDDLKKCLGFDLSDQGLKNQQEYFFKNMRSSQSSHQTLNKFNQKQPYLFNKSSSKWRIQDKQLDFQENQESVKNYYEYEFLRKNDTEIDKKNKTFMTEYIRYLSDFQKFQIKNVQLQNKDVKQFKHDYPQKFITQCKSQKCFDQHVYKVDPNLINFSTHEDQTISIEGKNKFELEKSSLKSVMKNFGKDKLQKILYKIQNRKILSPPKETRIYRSFSKK